MKKTGIWLLAALLLILIGIIIFTWALSMMKWDFAKFNKTKFETNTYELNEEFKNISIETKTADITFLPSDDGKTKVVCYEEEKVTHSVETSEETLYIKEINTRKWYDYIGVHFETPKITVYLPEKEYSSLLVKGETGDVELPKDFEFQSIDIEVSTGDVSCLAPSSKSVNITASTGDLRVEGITADSLNLCTSTGRITITSANCDGDITLAVSTGKTYLTDVSCNNLTSAGDTGGISLKNVIAKETISTSRSTGGVTFDSCDAAELSVVTDTGSVKGTLLSDKIFAVETDTGKIDVPDSSAGGKCKIKTDTGSIKIEIVN